MSLRPESPSDYAAIAELTALAFDGRAVEPAIVALLRQSPRFDPGLSLVAEVDGRVVGHVLFTPHSVQLLGQPVPAVALAPLAIHPACQRRGLGGQLIEAGHALARERGFAFSFLLGHPTYYPRFGYHTHAYGVASLTIPAAGLPPPTLSARPLVPADVPALHALWQTAEAQVDFALDPGHALVDWLSPNPAITAIVFQQGDTIVAYARLHRDEPHRPRALLAANGHVTLAVAAHLAQTTAAAVVLPVHPASAAASGLTGATATAWEAGMACPLVPSPLDNYLAQRTAGQRSPGSVVWPVAFDVA